MENIKKNKTEQDFRKELCYFTMEDFIGIAEILNISIYTKEEDNVKARKPFKQIEDEMVEKFNGFPRDIRRKFLRRVHQISKYNQKEIKKVTNK